MNPCRKVGLDVTWRCNWRCTHCFYRWGADLHKHVDTPLDECYAKLTRAKAGGMNHAVMVGFGEPTLYPQAAALVKMCRTMGLACSMITNGTAFLDKYAELFALGLDHVHVSSHATGETLDAITGDYGAWAKQCVLKAWLGREKLPYRSNVTIQRLNYAKLPEIVAADMEQGAWQQVLLGFLPHYEWGTDRDRLREIAVHPGLIRPYLEEAAFLLLEAGRRFSIRYHPFCHIDESLWPYVTNARYVFMDPFEWNYTLDARDAGAVWKASVACGEAAACPSCKGCAAYRHCGGWNRTYAAAFDGAGLHHIKKAPAMWENVWEQDGGLFDLNPTNAHSGTLR